MRSNFGQAAVQAAEGHREGDAAWDALEAFNGPLQSFWALFLKAAGQSLPARRVVLLSASVGTPWTAIAQWPGDARQEDGDAQALLQMAPRLIDDAPVLGALPGGGQILGLRLPHGKLGPQQVAAVVSFVLPAQELTHHDLSAWVLQANETTARYGDSVDEDRFNGRASEGDASNPSKAQRLFEILQLSTQLLQHKQALRMAYELCNALAARFDAERVALGWFDGAHVRLHAVSHIEKFDRLSTTSRALESAMEEAADQTAAVRYPSSSESRLVHRSHETYALMQGVTAVLSLPLLDGPRVRGVLCLERRQGLWSDDDLWELELTVGIVCQMLFHLRDRDRWWGARTWSAIKAWPVLAMSPRHTAWKLAGALSILTVIALCVVPWTYRVDATITVRSKDVLFVPSPFDGYLGQVRVEVGDTVKKGQVLVRLDTRELALEAAMAGSDLVRYRREAEKAQVGRQLAEMEVNLARVDQSASRLALVRHQLASAEVTAPHDGIVIEGELKKNLGAPLRKGDLLLKLAKVDQTYLELQVDQVDVHEVQVGTRGEFALVGRPDQRFPIVVTRIDPASALREGRNVFFARADLQTEGSDWWRPGMGGTARLEVGQRPLIWVLTHRTVRTLREWFWL